MKWTRYPCQLAYWNKNPIAFFNPVWAPEITRVSSSSPRTFNEVRNVVQDLSFFRVSDVEAEHFPAPICSNPDRDNDRLGHHPVIHTRFVLGRVEEYIWESQRGKRPATELRHLRSAAGADPSDFGVRSSISRHQRQPFSESRQPSGSRHRANTLPSRRRTRPDRSAGGVLTVRGRTFPPAVSSIFKPRSQSRCGLHSRAASIVVGAAFIGASEQRSADERASFRVHQLLVGHAGRGPDSVGEIGEFFLANKIVQGKLVGGHRLVSFA